MPAANIAFIVLSSTACRGHVSIRQHTSAQSEHTCNEYCLHYFVVECELRCVCVCALRAEGRIAKERARVRE